MAKVNIPISKSLILIVKAYQYCLSPLFGTCCRFYPSCSVYSIQALEAHGLLRGSLLAIKRILSCHPWHQGGIDPVPEKTHYDK